MHTKKERTCIACRRKKNQNDMIRVCKFNGIVIVEKQHSPFGRGAYICNSKDCVELVIKKRLLNRAFKANLDVEIYNQLGEYEQNN